MKIRHLALLAAFTAYAILGAPSEALAGGGGAEFQAVYDTLTEWTEGVLGRILAVVMVIAGVGMGVVRQSLAAFGVGIGGALGLVNAPAIVDNIVTAAVVEDATIEQSLPAVLAVIESVAQ